MNVEAFLRTATNQLSDAGIATARLDVLVLLEEVLNKNRVHILANPDLLITATQQKRLDLLVARRLNHEPLAYIRNQTEFYGRVFYVDNSVLEPRPESETMIELLKRLGVRPSNPIIDIGTGSGALAITAKLEMPGADVLGLDIDSKCLTVARKNAKNLMADVHFVKSDLLQSITRKKLDGAALLCNLPYVPDTFQINTAAGHEPRLAIFGGPDGLDVYRSLFTQIRSSNCKPAYILTEALPPQHEVLKNIAQDSGFVLTQSQDFIQVFRTGTDSSAL